MSLAEQVKAAQEQCVKIQEHLALTERFLALIVEVDQYLTFTAPQRTFIINKYGGMKQDLLALVNALP